MNNDGLIIINKPKNWTSFDIIAKLRKLLNTKKIGHTGTLDYNAKGVLVCLVGDACKLQDFFMKGKKIYNAELIIGISTDTEDITGEIVSKKYINKEDNQFFEDINLFNGKILKSFIGSYKQIPPMYSAKKIDGQKLLDLARKGITRDRKACYIEIYNLEIINPNESIQYVDDTMIDDNISDDIKNNIIRYFIKVECSKGTYIRTLCKDIGEKIGYPSCMGNLTRIDNTGFKISESFTIDNIKNKIDNHDYSFIKPALYLDKNQVVSFGKFETLHLGHKKIIDEVLLNAKKSNMESSVLVIKKNDSIENNNQNLKIKNIKNLFLDKNEQKSKLRQFGIDNVLYFNLNDYNKKMSGKDFVEEILINQMKSKIIIVGSDCSFGFKGSCNVNDLIQYTKPYNVKVIVVDKLEVPKDYNIDEKYISSTLIKKLATNNNIDLAKKLLGREVKYEKNSCSS